MDKNIGILGGDLRIINLSKMFAKDGYNVYTYGLENAEFSNLNIVKCKSFEELRKLCDNIISAIPFSKDRVNINSPFSGRNISIDETLEILSDKNLIAGAINNEVKEKAKKNRINIIDLMDDERLTILNVIPTVEGAIQLAMENTDITIHNSNCLVLGFGRIGKLLCRTLKELGANVSCMARKDKDLTWIKTYGYKDVNIDNLSWSLNNNRYDIIFNTIPTLILDNKKLEILKEKNSNVIIIDLASTPGGVDFEKAREHDIKTIHALGLPGKVAPVTAAKYIKETLDKL